MKIDVCGLGNPLMDILVYIDDEFPPAKRIAQGHNAPYR